MPRSVTTPDGLALGLVGTKQKGIAVVDLTPIVVSCFVLAMLSLMGGLLLLLLDTRLASRLILHRF